MHFQQFRPFRSSDQVPQVWRITRGKPLGSFSTVRLYRHLMRVASRVTKHSISWLAWLCVLAIGCDAPIDSFDSNEIFAKRLEMTGAPELEQPVEDARWILEEWLGTPDDPRWPEFLEAEEATASLVSIERLRRAAGPVRSDEDGQHWGLYREHCIVCHGVSGSGLGPTAALLNPYPRDFRLGKIKFKSTPIGEKPTRHDLLRTLKHGIAGTSMPSFGLLEEQDLEALVDYVIFLSVRGEVERALLAEAAFELDVEAGERLCDPDWKEADPTQFQERWDIVEGVTRRVALSWADADASVLQNVEPPPGFPLVGQAQGEADQQRLAASIANGRKLFQGNVASCAFCHGPEAKGDGQQNNYDDWTRDWTVLAGLDPKNREELRPMRALGALKPRNILPRNLQRGIFRGGSDPVDLYTRIVHGIEGTPMPAAPVQPANPQGLTEEEVWDLVNFLLNLRNELIEREEATDG